MLTCKTEKCDELTNKITSVSIYRQIGLIISVSKRNLSVTLVFFRWMEQGALNSNAREWETKTDSMHLLSTNVIM